MRNGFDNRMSQLAKALSRRIVFRSRIVPLAQILSVGAVARCPLGALLMHFSDVGWAEYQEKRVLP